MWTRTPDPRCLRGLAFLYRTRAPFCPACFEERVHAQLPDQLLSAVEPMGEVPLHRMILQFRFELRFGMRPGELEVHHRVLADEATRERTYRVVEAALGEALAARGCAHA